MWNAIRVSKIVRRGPAQQWNSEIGKQHNSETGKQHNSKTVKQQNIETVKKQNSETGKWLSTFLGNGEV